jgi:N utilization substance protein B
LERAGVIERCVLRLAFYELEHTDTPVPVVINEAVDLAKYFSNPEAGAFVNGILDRHARRRSAN